MSVYNREIKEAMKHMAGTFNGTGIKAYLCSVESVDETAKTCTVIPISDLATTEINNVMLNTEPNDGLTLIPSVDSTVLVGISDKNIPFIIMFEDIDKVLLKIGNSTLTITDGLFEFNGGSNGGLILITNLVTKINNLENKVNDLVLFTATHVHSGVQTGAGTSGTAVTPVTGELTPTNRADIEDTTITH